MLKARVSQGVPKSTPFLVSPAMAGSILAGRANYNAHAFCHGIDGNRTNQVIRSQSQGLSDEDIRNLATFKASQASQYRPASEENRSFAVIHHYGRVDGRAYALNEMMYELVDKISENQVEVVVAHIQPLP